MHKHFYKTNKMCYHRKKNWVADNQLFKFPNVTETGCSKYCWCGIISKEIVSTNFALKDWRYEQVYIFLNFEINSLKADRRSFMGFTYIYKNETFSSSIYLSTLAILSCSGNQMCLAIQYNERVHRRATTRQ